jgi:hypothetical protein
MKHTLPTDTINKVLNFLAGRPYSEVANLIAEIKANAVEYVHTPLPAKDCEDCAAEASPE